MQAKFFYEKLTSTCQNMHVYNMLLKSEEDDIKWAQKSNSSRCDITASETVTVYELKIYIYAI